MQTRILVEIYIKWGHPMVTYPRFTLAHRGPFEPQSAQNLLSSLRTIPSSSAGTPDLFVPDLNIRFFQFSKTRSRNN